MIGAKSVFTGGDFKLASGGQSSVFFDMKMTLLDPEGINFVADLMVQLLEGEACDAIGGLVLGACPIVDAVIVKAYPTRRITGFYVRKEPKERGTNKMIEGPLAPGSACVMVEDVTTLGNSVLKAVAEARGGLHGRDRGDLRRSPAGRARRSGRRGHRPQVAVHDGRVSGVTGRRRRTIEQAELLFGQRTGLI